MISMNCLGSIGRLGNQMFQYAALRSLSKKFNYEYCLPEEGEKMYNEDMNIYECFKLNNEQRVNTNLYPIKIRNFGIDENIIHRCPDNVDLEGYFQDISYFLDNEDDIRSSFAFLDKHLEEASKQFVPSFGAEDVISLHVRRGDYLKFSHHPVQTIDYYFKALKFFKKDLKVLIFSDDIDWASQQPLFQSERFLFSRNNNTAVDLCMQSMCTHHIITNSTYSWWGAWLANSKKVVKPKIWFGPPIEGYNDFLKVDGWISI